MAQIQLTPAERAVHRAEAHHLDPVVMIGHGGLTAAVRKEADAALNVHGLIKIRVLEGDHGERAALLHGGKLMHFAPADDVYVYFRYDGAHGEGGKSVMVALNKGKDAKALALDRFAAFLEGRKAREALSGKPVALNASLMLPGKSATLLEID